MNLLYVHFKEVFHYFSGFQPVLSSALLITVTSRVCSAATFQSSWNLSLGSPSQYWASASYFVVENTKILYFSLKREQFEGSLRLLCRHDFWQKKQTAVTSFSIICLNRFMNTIFQWRILRGCMCQCVLCCTHADARSFDEYFDSEDEIDIEQFDRPDINKLYMAGKVVHICKIRSVYPRYGWSFWNCLTH